MNERPPMGDMRPKLKEVALPIDTVKELADLIPKPVDQYHYRVTGDWQENREVYRVHEADNVISDYSFPEKSDMSKVQFATRKTYTKEMNMLGKLVDLPVQYDRKSDTWKKLNIFQRVKQVFTKETYIPGQVVTESVNGKDVAVLHTLEKKRPVGKTVKEAELGTLQDAKVDLGLKYKHMDHTLFLSQQINKKLSTEVRVAQGQVAALAAQLAQANARIAELTGQQRVSEAQAFVAKDKANQADVHYKGPIYTKPNPDDVVEGEVVG